MSKDSYSTYYYLLCGFGTGILLAVAIFAPLYLAIVPGREPDAARVHGLWEVTSVRNLTTGQLQPHRREYQLFGKTHQMVVLAGAGRPKLTKSLSDMSPEEILSQQPIGAGLYQYEVEDSKISRTNVAALSAYYEGRTFVGEIELIGDTLVLRDSHSADGQEREWTMRRIAPSY